MTQPIVTLTPQLATHAPALFAILSDPALYEHEGSPPPSLEWLLERFARLESRRSADGSEKWLNWVIELPTGASIGYVQASVYADHSADIAYTLGSAYWGRGLATAAVQLMVSELVRAHQVGALSAMLKRTNARSLRLLERLGFTPAPESLREQRQAAGDLDSSELLLVRPAQLPLKGPS